MKPTWTIRRHVMAWVVVAGFALAYLTSLFLLPYGDPSGEMVATATGDSGRQGDKPVSPIAGVADRNRTGPEVDLESLRSEIAMLRRQVEKLKSTETALRERLAVVESAFGPNTAALPPQNEETAITGSLKEGKPAPQHQPLPEVTVAYSDMPEDGFGDVLFDASPLPVAGVQQTTQTLFGVELASGPTSESLHKAWTELGTRHKALLGGLEARRQRVAASDTHKDGDMKLIAGPFPNAAGAALLCARLRAAGAHCKETVFTGDAF